MGIRKGLRRIDLRKYGHPENGGRRSAVGGRRSAVGGRRPAGETRCVAFGRDSVSAHFQFKLKTLPNFAPPGENKGV